MKETDYFYDRVKRLIKQNNMTQEKLAKACNINVGTFRGWIAKGIYPTVIDAYYLAKALGISLDYLVTGKNKAEKNNEKRIENVNSLLDRAKTELGKIR
ncbi:MAG: helix-turn-helix domain-containing protein [Treponema sp.]|jgi:transcriptional regulator with XRE-family HTH domain|nr:helix-turn-helix domain-containing protein [Treponema sp.]